MQYAALNRHSPARAAWRRTASLCAIIATTATGKAFSADTFDPYVMPPEPVRATDWRDMLVAVEQLNADLGGADRRASSRGG